VIEDLTLFERLESGAERVVANRFSLFCLAKDLEGLLDERARGKGVELTVSVDGATVDVVSDRRYLARILVNLVTNAFAATPFGGRVVCRLALNHTEESGFTLHFAVEDSGRGLDADALAALRAGNLPGYGFTVVTELVNALRGRLEITSTLGCGTRVTVAVPVDTCTEPVPAPVSSASTAAEQRILLVEDVVENRLIMRELLESLGHRVTAAGTLAECRHALETSDFDIVLLDRQLPDGDGLATLDNLHAICDRNERHPRFMLVTADVGADLRDKAHESGFDALLTKPFSKEQLADAIAGEQELLPEGVLVAPVSYPDQLPPELWQEVLRGFATTAREVSETLSEAAQEGDVQRALAASHRLVGSASMASFCQLADHARRLNTELQETGVVNRLSIQRLIDAVRTVQSTD